MSDKANGFRNELGDGYLNLLDSVRHSFEQAAWGQETSGDLAADDFYRWVGPAEEAPKPIEAAERGAGGQVRAAEAPSVIEISDDIDSDFQRLARSFKDAPAVEVPQAKIVAVEDWKEFEWWIDGKSAPMTESEIQDARDSCGLSREGPEIGE